MGRVAWGFGEHGDREKNCKENMIRGEIKLKSKEPDQNKKCHLVALVTSLNGNEVENRGNVMGEVMLAKSSCIFVVKIFLGLNYVTSSSILYFAFALCRQKYIKRLPVSMTSV